MHKHAIGAALLVAAGHSAALSLGGTQGNAIIGRPLDLLVRTSVESAEAAAGLCLEAELLYGDNRVQASAVTVALNKLGADGTGTLRVRSTQPVNEPVVTLVLKAGCSTRYTRSYALLADFVPLPPAAPARELPTPRVQDVLPPARPTPPAPAPEVRETVKPTAKVRAEPESPIRLPPPQPRPAGVTRALAKSKPVKAQVAAPANPAPAANVAMRGPAEPRLKLDLVDLGTASQAAGKEVSAPASAPVPAEQKPAPRPPQENVAATTAAATPAPEPEAQKMKDMVRELEGLRAEQAKMRAAVEAVNAQLTQARGQSRYLDPLVLGLIGLSAASLATLAWLWSSLRRQRVVAGAGARDSTRD